MGDRSAGSRFQVVVSDAQGRATAPGLARWIVRVAPAAARGAVSIAVVSDQRVRALNRQYRGIDRPTDVLSFPMQERPPRPTPTAQRHHAFVGDIVIAR